MRRRYFGPDFNPGDIPTLDPREHDEEFVDGQIVLLPAGSYLMRCSRTRPWQRIEVETVRAGQPRPYADSVHEVVVTFSGGTPSTVPGWHLQFATRPPFDEDQYRTPGRQVFDKHTHLGLEGAIKARKRDHDDHIKAIIRPFCGWQTDSTKGEMRTAGASWLDVFECVSAVPFSTTYRLVAKTPYM